MTELVLVDSNVFIDLLRKRQNPVEVLENWRGERDLLTCGMVRLEVERGIATEKVRTYLGRFFELMRFAPTTNQLWGETVELAWRLDRKGRVLPAADLVIAAHALKFGASILTADRHFEQVPGLKVYRPEDELRA